MKPRFRIVCPTYKRAGKLKVTKIFGSEITLAVCESEEDIYKEHHKNELMILPEDCKRNMPRIRNHIRNNSRTEWVVMIDDDVCAIGYIEDGIQYPMTKNHIYEFIDNMFHMAEELGTVLWGVNLCKDPKWYREYSPFSFLSPILAPFHGHIVKNDDLAYDERFLSKEDYDYPLQVLHKYHKVLRSNKHYYIADHLTLPGGFADYRDMEFEVKQLKLLQKKWGDKIVRFDITKSVNPKVFVPLKGI